MCEIYIEYMANFNPFRPLSTISEKASQRTGKKERGAEVWVELVQRVKENTWSVKIHSFHNALLLIKIVFFLQ